MTKFRQLVVFLSCFSGCAPVAEKPKTARVPAANVSPVAINKPPLEARRHSQPTAKDALKPPPEKAFDEFDELDPNNMRVGLIGTLPRESGIYKYFVASAYDQDVLVVVEQLRNNVWEPEGGRFFLKDPEIARECLKIQEKKRSDLSIDVPISLPSVYRVIGTKAAGNISLPRLAQHR